MRFLSEPLMAGFISAVGVIIIATQLGPLLGYDVPQESLAAETAYEWAKRLDQVDWGTLAIGATTIVVLLLARRRPRIPTARWALSDRGLAGGACVRARSRRRR